MAKQPATADSWKIRPMPEARRVLEIDGVFSAEEMETISLGFVPQDQDDRWFIYFDGEWLHFHRSWTGTCVFQLQIVPEADYYRATTAVANRDPEQYKGTDDEHDVALISFLIDSLLLGRFGQFPAPSGLSEADQARHRQHVMGQRGTGAASISLRVIKNGRGNN